MKEFDAVVSEFYYSQSPVSVNYQPLPTWCRFFLQLGHFASQHTNSHRRIIVVAALPARHYAAMFVSLGIVLHHALHLNEDSERHLKRLKSLRQGEPVHVLEAESNDYCPGEFVTITPQYIVVQTFTRGNTKRHIPLTDPYRVLMSETKVKVPKNPGKKAQGVPELVSAIFGARRAARFTLESDLNVMIIGNTNALKAEVSMTQLIYRSARGTYVAGGVQEIMREKSLAKRHRGHRTRILPARSERTGELARHLKPPVVTFDGANAFLKWSHSVPSSSWMVLLDRTRPRFHEAVSTLNQLAMYREKELRVPKVPHGIELMVFTEARSG